MKAVARGRGLVGCSVRRINTDARDVLESLSRRQKYRKDATASASLRAASHAQDAMMSLDSIFDERESQARAGSSFGGKEGLGYFGQVLRCYPAAVIRKRHPQSASPESRPLARPGHSGVHCSPSWHRICSIQQEIGEHLTQGTRIDRKVFTRAVASFNPDALRAQLRHVKIDHGTQQPRYVGVLWTHGTSETIHRPVCDLGNAVNFFLCERQVMTTRGRCLGFNEVEEIQERIEGIVDLVGERGTQHTIGCGRSNSFCFFDTQGTPGNPASLNACSICFV